MRLRRIAVVVLLIAATGCSFFSRSKSRIYSLDRIPPSGAVVSVRGVPVGIDIVELPPGLDRREVVVRKADQQLDVRSTEQWSAQLQPLVLHTLAFDLADRLPVGMVILPGEAKPIGVTRSIDVVFADLAAGPEPRINVDLRWIVHESGHAAVAHREQFTVDIPSLDSTSVASGTSRALATLADRIAGQL